MDLTWDYPVEGPRDEPSADAVLAEINGSDAQRQAAVVLHPAQGRRSHGLRLLDLLRRLRRRREPGRPAQARPGAELGRARVGLGVARSTGASSTTAPRPTRTASRGASARPWSGGTRTPGKWTGHDVPDFVADRPPVLPAARRCHRAWTRSPATTRSSCRPTARPGCSPRPGLVDGPLPAHYEPQESPFANPLYGAAAQPGPARSSAPAEPVPARRRRAGRRGVPLRAPPPTGSPSITPRAACSRWLPYLSELQPEFFCEVSPELAAERGLSHLGWATIVTARTAIEARVTGHRADGPSERAGPPAAPDRAALPLGRQRPQHRRLAPTT